MYSGQDMKWILGLLGSLLTILGFILLNEINESTLEAKRDFEPNPYFIPIFLIVFGLLFFGLINLKKRNKQ